MPDRFGEPAEVPRVFTRPTVNPLTVKCSWCKANVGFRCVIPNTSIQLRKSGFHDARKQSADLSARDAYAKGRMNHG